MAFRANTVNMEDAKLRRKLNKPLVEKRRRERINKYLYELHSLLSDADQTTPANKLEKADILEMAVSHIRNLKCKLRNKAAEAAAANNIEQSDRIHEAISSPQTLNIRIPSPTSSITSSTGYPSPTPSIENVPQQQALRLPIAILLPQQPQDQHQHMLYNNTTGTPMRSYGQSLRYQPYHHRNNGLTAQQQISARGNQISASQQSNLENIKPRAMWRPW